MNISFLDSMEKSSKIIYYLARKANNILGNIQPLVMNVTGTKSSGQFSTNWLFKKFFLSL